jgi:cysteine desulfurase
MKRTYLDYAATTPMRSEVAEAMRPYFTEAFGNPSTIYSYGLEAKGAVEAARTKVARLINAREEEIVFTSGGTEADNYALIGTAYAAEGKKDHIITSAIEHHAILETAKFLETRGFKVTYLPVDKYGIVNPDDVKKAITAKTVLISVMHANNEIGTVEPVEQIGSVAREAGVYFHTDAVQTAGHIPVDVEKIGTSLLSISAHKLYGPKGVGILYVRKGTRITPLIHGGEQEKGRRSGTENVPGIVGLGTAAELAQGELEQEVVRIRQLRDRLVDGIKEKITDIKFNGHPETRLPNNINICVAYVEGESMALNLDLEGVCASTGSACSSASSEPSHVLSAIGVPPEISHGSLRFTLGKWTNGQDVDRVLEVLPRIVAKLRAMSPLLKSHR